MLTYCTKCIMPSTKPDLHLDENGVCNACSSYENRREVDWQARKTQLTEILDKYRCKNGENWDCIVPPSVVATALEFSRSSFIARFSRAISAYMRLSFSFSS